MIPLPKSIFGMDAKLIVLLQLFNNKLRNGTKTFLELKFFSTLIKY